MSAHHAVGSPGRPGRQARHPRQHLAELAEQVYPDPFCALIAGGAQQQEQEVREVPLRRRDGDAVGDGLGERPESQTPLADSVNSPAADVRHVSKRPSLDWKYLLIKATLTPASSAIWRTVVAA